MNPFSSPSPVEHQVNGQTFKFFPPRTWTVSRLKGFLKPLFQAIETLARTNETDIGREQIDESNPAGGMSRRVNLTAVDPKLAQMRADERERVLNTLIETLTSQQGMRCLVMLITDSMREDFPKRLSDTELDQLIDSWDLDQLVQALHGVAMASKELFAPLMERVGPGLTTLSQQLKKAPVAAQPKEQPAENATSGTSSSSPSS